jgi:hypothetical protein
MSPVEGDRKLNTARVLTSKYNVTPTTPKQLVSRCQSSALNVQQFSIFKQMFNDEDPNKQAL